MFSLFNVSVRVMFKVSISQPKNVIFSINIDLIGRTVTGILWKVHYQSILKISGPTINR